MNEPRNAEASRNSREELKWKVASQVLSAAKDDYERHERVFAALDAKAQTTAAVAGVLIAALVAILGSRTVSNSDTLGERGMIAAVFFLLTSVLFCLLAMWLRRVVLPPRSSALSKMAEDVTRSQNPPLDDQQMANWFQTCATLWQEPICRIAALNRRKGTLLFLGQLFLGLAMVAEAMLISIVALNALHIRSAP